MNFNNIEYLRNGTQRQKVAFEAMVSLKTFEILKDYQPILTGSIPIDIDLPNSDLDIICSAENFDSFQKHVRKNFGRLHQFELLESQSDNVPSVVANFKYCNFDFEIFCQPIPTVNQSAYKHMIIEYKLLSLAHPKVKQEIKRLKSKGLKTEPAFAQVFQLSDNPYQALLDLSQASDDELKEIANKWRL